MASSYYASCFLILVALTAPSAANVVTMVNLNGALVCAGTGTPAAANVTASLVCGSQFVGAGVVLVVTTTAAGTIIASINVGPRTKTVITSALCLLLLPPQACPGTANVTIGTKVTVSQSRNTLIVIPSSQVARLPDLPVST